MLIHDRVKDMMEEYKHEIERIQCAIIMGVSSLFYSEYISKFRQKEFPLLRVEVPSLKNLARFLDQNSEFMQTLSYTLIDKLANHKLIKKYLDVPELFMFNDNNIEIMKIIYDIRITHNIRKCIMDLIVKKFRLDDPTQQVFQQNWEIDIFNGQINDDQINFVIDEIVLQLLMLIPSINKETRDVSPDLYNVLWFDEILSIDNNNAICPIYVNMDIINNESIIKLLSFVTDSTFDKDDKSIIPVSNSNNQLRIIKLL